MSFAPERMAVRNYAILSIGLTPLSTITIKETTKKHMVKSPTTSYLLQGSALSIAVSTFFAAIWGIQGGLALVGGLRWLTIIVVAIVTLLLGFTAYRFLRAGVQLPAATDDPPLNPFRNRWYLLAVAAEVVAIPIAGRLLSGAGRTDMIMPVVAMIVGIHFFGLIPAFHSWHFAWVGGAFCVLALVALLLPAQLIVDGVNTGIALRHVVVGIGCALILWLGTLPLIRAIGQLTVDS